MYLPSIEGFNMTSTDSQTAMAAQKRGMHPLNRVLLILGAIPIGLLGLHAHNLTEQLSEYDTKDLTPDLSSYVVGHVYQTVGGCDATSSPIRTYYNAMFGEFETGPVKDWGEIFCPALPNVNEPNPDKETQFLVAGKLYTDCVGNFRAPSGDERGKVFLGVTCKR